MSLMIATWTMFKYPVTWNKFDLDCILDGMEDLTQEFLVENPSINVEFLENKAREITSISEIVDSAQQIGTGAPRIVSNYILV